MINEPTNQAMLTCIAEMNRAMQSNPRFARLVQLGMKKSCEAPAAGGK